MYILYVSKSKTDKVIFLSETEGFTILSSNILVTKNNQIDGPKRFYLFGFSWVKVDLFYVLSCAMQTDVFCLTFFRSHDCDLFALTEWSAFIAVLNLWCGLAGEVHNYWCCVLTQISQRRMKAYPLEMRLLAVTQKHVSIQPDLWGSLLLSLAAEQLNLWPFSLPAIQIMNLGHC